MLPKAYCGLGHNHGTKQEEWDGKAEVTYKSGGASELFLRPVVYAREHKISTQINEIAKTDRQMGLDVDKLEHILL